MKKHKKTIKNKKLISEKFISDHKILYPPQWWGGIKLVVCINSIMAKVGPSVGYFARTSYNLF